MGRPGRPGRGPEHARRGRADFPAAKTAFEAAGFIYRHSTSLDMFLDGPGAKERDAVHILWANERVRPTDPAPTADVSEYEADPSGRYHHLTLEALVRMKLTSHRDKDRTHLRDLIGVGLVDATWPAKYPPELAARIQAILDTPEG